jgi:transposase
VERYPTAWTREEKSAFRAETLRITDAATRIRYLVILHTAEGHSQSEIADMLACSIKTVSRVQQRFREHGPEGLLDRRGDNGTTKVTYDYILALMEAVRGSPRDYGYPRPTWTQELLIKVMEERKGIRVHPSTMSRLLRRLGIRRGMPKPTVGCPWSSRARKRRLGLIRRMIETLPPDQAAVWEDEIDIHLNPKIGLDWMGLGQQKEVVTPGKNEKRYLAGALDVRTGAVHWVEGQKKDRWLFLNLLKKLTEVYAKAKVIHVILDNYAIHSSKVVGIALAYFARRVRLHFLPPYCPDHNRIERLWQDLHAHVTRNHRCPNMTELMREVRYYLRKRNRRAQTWVVKKSAA